MTYSPIDYEEGRKIGQMEGYERGFSEARDRERRLDRLVMLAAGLVARGHIDLTDEYITAKAAKLLAALEAAAQKEGGE